MKTPSDADFRKAGYTAAARNYPLSPGAQRVIAEENRIDPVDMPDAWRFSPNEWCRRRLEEKAVALGYTPAEGES